MNILIPAHFFTDDPKSGLHTVIWNTAKHLALKGHRVFVVATYLDLTFETRKSLRQKNILIYRAGNFPVHNLGYTEAFLTFLYSCFLRIFCKFDWIYVIDTAKTPFSRFKLGSKLACRVLKPLNPEINNIINGPDWSYDRDRKDLEEIWQNRKEPIFYRIKRFLAVRIWFKLFPVAELGQNADVLFCQGMDTLRFYEQKGLKNLYYLPNGVENYRFDQIKADQDKENMFTFLFIGRIARRKGIFYLLEAFNILYEKYKDIELKIIGKGSEEMEGTVRKDFGDLIDLGVVKLLGEKGREETVKSIKSADVIVDPMLFAGFSSVVLEGLYAKKAVIAPLYGGTKDFIKDGENGFLVYSPNIESLAQKMEFYYLNREMAKSMSLKGYDFVSKNLTWDKVADMILKSFNEAR